MTVLGTRPEIIRLSLVISRLDTLCEHVVVHTGQNFAYSLGRVFYDEMNLRAPDIELDCRADTLMGQVARILTGCEEAMLRERPDRLLILGDTNSALAAIVAKRLGIPVFHMEAGNRCYDDRVPEEVNRRIVDHSSDVLMPYTERSRENLLREGITGNRIYVTGNPIKEVLEAFAPQIAQSQALTKLGVDAGKYMLVTLHRAENVDVPDRLTRFIAALQQLAEDHGVPVLCSLHPRTRSQLERQGKDLAGGNVRTFEPLGLFDFVRLQQDARCVLSDSGTVQEECCIFGVPNVTIRDVTERPETLEVGSNMLSGSDPEMVKACVATVLSQKKPWEPPPEYLVANVSDSVVRIVLGHREWAFRPSVVPN
jgi:UDP-N-acetylglucosamine 2-epimerase (non-hydrolysing)